MTQSQLADAFTALHVKGKPLIMYNIWDPGSAKAVAETGAAAIATGSAPVAMAQGYGDGEKIPMEAALDNARRITSAVSLPVSLDFEGAYAVAPDAVAENFTKALDTGVVGFNFEDQVVGGEGLHDILIQSKRIAAARQACEAAGIKAFINARTDLFLKAKLAGEAHTPDMLEAAIERAAAFAEAGASGFFAPGLLDIDMIATLCERVSLPVNIIALPGAPDSRALAEAGVARVSYGPVPYKKMIAWFTQQAESAISAI